MIIMVCVKRKGRRDEREKEKQNCFLVNENVAIQVYSTKLKHCDLIVLRLRQYKQNTN